MGTWNDEFTPMGETVTEVKIWNGFGNGEILYLPHDMEKLEREGDDRLKCAVWMALKGLDAEEAIVEEDPRKKGYELRKTKVCYYRFKTGGDLTYRKTEERFVMHHEAPENRRTARKRFVVEACRGENMKAYRAGIGARNRFGITCF